MKKKELHLVIVWDAAIDVLDKIINKIDTDFIIKDIYNITWDKELFVDNLISFYSHSQYHLNARKAKRLFVGKANYCGIAPFNLIVFEDDNPTYELRNTSSGEREVNSNVFDLKLHFRELTGGGHKIHGTDSIKETNKDLTLLLGTNIKDFYKNHNGVWDRKTKSLSRNITGVKGYNSLEEFFYVLNASLDYVVLRNFESFPDDYVSDEHGDIDLLVDNLNLIVYLTWAKKVFNKKNRVHYTIIINNEAVPFDFRYIGDNYYDLKWEKDILNTRVLKDDVFYIPNTENLFYSLLYHALVHKYKFSNDYKQKIKALNNNRLISDEEGYDLLYNFLQDNGYRIEEPIDVSVLFNTKKINYSKKISFQRKFRMIKGIVAEKKKKKKKEIGILYYKNIELVNSLFWIIPNYAKFKKVLKNEYGISKVKVFNLLDWHNGASYFRGISENNVKLFIKTDKFKINVLENELVAYKIFKTNKKDNLLPKVVAKSTLNGFDFIVYEYLDGYTSLSDIIKNKDTFTIEDRIRIYEEMYSFIKFLQSLNFVHRDFRPDNIMVKTNKSGVSIKVIDFSFVIDSNISANRQFVNLKKHKDYNQTINWLGDKYKPSVHKWDDAFSLYKIGVDLGIDESSEIMENSAKLIDENVYFE